jgi:uncharacterized protein (DUF1778 family)
LKPLACTANCRIFLIDLYAQWPYTRIVLKEKEEAMAQAHIHRSRKQERLEARLTPAQKQLIERAAALRGTSVTEFVVVSAQAAAASAIKDFEVLRLRDEAREVFINAILNPPAPTQAAHRAAERYKKNMGL